METPPFRADHVGSLLRPATAKAARDQVRAGTLDAAKLKAVEDAAIIELIRHQEAIGLHSITDGDDPARQPEIYAGLVRAALADKPADLVVTMHLCRGNFRSTFIASGGYEPVAELLFNTMPVDGYFMEWDTDRAGGFEPLRFLPKGKRAVLGLVTSKTGVLEDRNAVQRRIEDAAKFAPLDQLCLSPQCGFASTQEGNTLAETEQWAKLSMIVDLAAEVWA